MSEIEKFVSKYSNDTKTLEEKLKKIENLDISNIKKLDMIQEAKEEERLKERKNDFWKITPMEDTFIDELLLGYGAGSSMWDD